MKRFLVILFLSVITILSSTLSYTQFHDYDFYIKLGSGVSCSQSGNVCAPNPPWNQAVQGYNAHLGNCPIAALSVGCELWHALDVEFTVANRSLFKYKKFQTPTNGDASYTRTFDLDVTSVLFDVNMLGYSDPLCQDTKTKLFRNHTKASIDDIFCNLNCSNSFCFVGIIFKSKTASGV